MFCCQYILPLSYLHLQKYKVFPNYTINNQTKIHGQSYFMQKYFSISLLFLTFASE